MNDGLRTSVYDFPAEGSWSARWDGQRSAVGAGPGSNLGEGGDWWWLLEDYWWWWEVEDLGLRWWEDGYEYFWCASGTEGSRLYRFYRAPVKGDRGAPA